MLCVGSLSTSVGLYGLFLNVIKQAVCRLLFAKSSEGHHDR